MANVFSALSGLLLLLGVVAVLWALFTWDWTMLVVAALVLLHSYAWKAVDALVERLEHLERKVS